MTITDRLGHRPATGWTGLAGLLVAGLLLVGSAGCAVGPAGREEAATTQSSSSTSPSPARSPSSSPTPARIAKRAGGVVPEPPVGIELPGGQRVGIRAVGTTANGVLDVPDDVTLAGWWDGGSQVGDPFGSTLVAAHVDSTIQGLGPFASLLGVRPGDRVFLWSQGLRQTFEIRSRRLRPQGTLGARSWIHSPDGERRLTLVTCAGPFDAERGGYQNLAVIVAEPLGKAVRRR